MPTILKRLSVRQAKFVKALTTPNTPTYCKPTQAYRHISPMVKDQSARAGAMRLSTDLNVQSAIVGQLGLEDLGNELKTCLSTAQSVMKAKKPMVKLAAVRETRDTVMDYAKLTGQLIERRELVLLSDERRAMLRAMLPAIPQAVSGESSPAPAPEPT